MSFPLAEWIDRYSDLPHNLGGSGLRGQLKGRAAALSHLPEGDPGALRASLGRLNGAPGSRVFLTHGATEGNLLALQYLRRAVGAASARVRTRIPEYPPFRDVAEWLGFRWAGRRPRRGDVAVLSAPNNPEGILLAEEEEERLLDGVRAAIVDETFREMRGTPSRARDGDRRIWVTGSFTKMFGADEDRVGFVIPPPHEAEAFGRFHGLALDELPPVSVQRARALLAHRAEILAEARAIFRENLATLRRARPDVPELAAPLWFDRGRSATFGDRVARAGVRQGVLVSPGRFFGDPRGVRVCLTRRSFPEDLDAYLDVRQSVPDA